ncbi:MAG TPA: hypothetical protein VHJ83_15290 [Micromonosporaceae bacterium]|jgi:hypothetical protein|nr:hypothetical protein [Micromonosporaceae bacterium]
MRERWGAVGIATAAMFGFNAVARLIVWQASLVQDEEQILAGLLASIASALLAAVAGVRWAYRYPMSRVVADLGLAIIVASLLAVVVGPYLGGSRPLVEGVGFAVRQFLFYGGVMAFGAMLGVLGTVTLGKDWKSRGWRLHEQRIRRGPRRVP